MKPSSSEEPAPKSSACLNPSSNSCPSVPCIHIGTAPGGTHLEAPQYQAAEDYPRRGHVQEFFVPSPKTQDWPRARAESAGSIGTEPTVATHFRLLRCTESVGQSLVTYTRQKTKCRVPNTGKKTFCSTHIVFEDRFTWRASSDNTRQQPGLLGLRGGGAAAKSKRLSNRVSRVAQACSKPSSPSPFCPTGRELVLKRRRKVPLRKA